MSQQISFSGWVAIVPDRMIGSWVEKKFIPGTAVLAFSEIGEESKGKHGDVLHRMSLLDSKGHMKDFKWVKTNQEGLEYKKQGYESDNWSILLVDPKMYNKMRDQVNEWYDKVFDYVEQWLFESNLLHLSKGSLRTGFCVESDPEHEVVKGWGAPLAKKNNKVVQMKEKFGRIVVYFGGLTENERKHIDEFAKEVEGKFDCVADFC